MARTRKNNRSRSRSKSPQVQANRTHRTPNTGRGLVASAGRSARRIAQAAVQPVANLLHRAPGNTPQNTTNEEQSNVPSPATSTTVVFTPNRSDSNVDASQNSEASNTHASFLSEVAGRTPRFGSHSHTPDRSDSNVDASQNSEASNAHSSFLSEVAGRTP